MAWITVDQKLIGGKLRSFAKKSNISQNEAIGILIRLWLWAVDNTDSHGTIVAADTEDIEDALRPGFNPDRLEDIPDIVSNLIDCGWIDRGDRGLSVHDWTDWRSYYIDYMSGQDRREKDAERVRQYRARKAQQEQAKQPDESCDIPHEAFEDCRQNQQETKTENKQEQPEPEPEPKKKAKRAIEYTPEFEEFWTLYPRKVEKENAFKKYKTRLKEGYTDEQLTQAAKNYRATCEAEHTETRFIKHPKTFLSDTKPFMDYLEHDTQERQNTAYTQYAPYTSEPVRKFEEGENPFARMLEERRRNEI